MGQSITFQAKKQLERYLVDFQTTLIDKPYGAKSIRLRGLTHQENKVYAVKLYLESLSDGSITYNELKYISRKISDHKRLKK